MNADRSLQKTPHLNNAIEQTGDKNSLIPSIQPSFGTSGDIQVAFASPSIYAAAQNSSVDNLHQTGIPLDSLSPFIMNSMQGS